MSQPMHKNKAHNMLQSACSPVICPDLEQWVKVKFISSYWPIPGHGDWMEHTENGSTAKPEDGSEGHCFTNVNVKEL
jgi:hypothetical protein